MTAEDKIAVGQILVTRVTLDSRSLELCRLIEDIEKRSVNMNRLAELMRQNEELRERIVGLIKDGMEQKAFYEAVKPFSLVEAA